MSELMPVVVPMTVAEDNIVLPMTVKESGAAERSIVALDATENGEYHAPSGFAYDPVRVDVPVTTVTEQTFTANGDYDAGEGAAFNPVHVAVPGPVLETVERMYSVNGEYAIEPGTGYDGIGSASVTVEVPIPELEVPRKWTRPADWPNLDLIDVSQPRDEITAYITIFCDGTWQWLDGKNCFITAVEIELDESGNETIIQTLQYTYSGGGYMFDISPLSNGIHLIKMLSVGNAVYLSRSVLENVQQKTLESIVVWARNFSSITLNTGNQRDWLPGVSVSCRHLAVYWLTADRIENTSCIFGHAPALEKVEFYHCEFSGSLLAHSLRYNTQLVELSFSECEYTPNAYSSPQPIGTYNLETWIMPDSWDWSVLTTAENIINQNCYMLKNFSGLKNAAINQNYTNCIHLTVQSLMNIINGLPTVSTVQTLTLGAINKAKLTAEQIAVATQKGWTVA